jgi:hypothetical protein
MTTIFKKLNENWNAEPNAACPQVSAFDGDIVLGFLVNAFRFRQFAEGDIGLLRFRNCRRYRLGATNDEGWRRGQCRFSKIAPAWGEFYEVEGDLLLDSWPLKWEESVNIGGQRHFLFYFRDHTFECDARTWSFSVLK